MSCNLSYDDNGDLVVAYCQGIMVVPGGYVPDEDES